MSDSKWISVDERLPEVTPITQRFSDSRRVLVNCSYGVFIATFRRRSGGMAWIDDDGWPFDAVTHWQPLPPPPGEVGS